MNADKRDVADLIFRVLATRFWRMSNEHLAGALATLYHLDDC
jgi:hypothetical protein